MERRLESVVADTANTRERFRSQRIIGTLYRFVAIAHDRIPNRYVFATQDLVVSLGGPQYVNRYAAFEAFRRALGMDVRRYRRRGLEAEIAELRRRDAELAKRQNGSRREFREGGKAGRVGAAHLRARSTTRGVTP
jgi:hypothetical protein